VVYEASFEPAALDKARIEFWLTDTGHVAVGVETYERVALRLGRRLARRGFAVGNEPRTETADALRKLFALVTRGKFFLEVKTILNIWNTARIYVEPSDYNTMIESGYRSSGWLSAIPNSDARPSRPLFGAILDYKPW
jgi:hypothetical protein